MLYFISWELPYDHDHDSPAVFMLSEEKYVQIVIHILTNYILKTPRDSACDQA
jgi:hypothetical protein